jgi:hypothetical protein
MESVTTRFGIPEDYVSSATVVADDTISDAEARGLMDSLVATIVAHETEVDVGTINRRTAVEEGILLSIAVNGSVARAHFRNKIHTDAGDFPASWIPNVLGANIRRFARYYADKTRYFLGLNTKAREQCLRKYGYAEDPTLSFDTAHFCSALTPETRNVLKRLGAERLSRSTNYDPATMEAQVEHDAPRVQLRRTHGGEEDLS